MGNHQDSLVGVRVSSGPTTAETRQRAGQVQGATVQSGKRTKRRIWVGLLCAVVAIGLIAAPAYSSLHKEDSAGNVTCSFIGSTIGIPCEGGRKDGSEIIGSDTHDTIEGSVGNDITLEGNDGDDTIDGGSGDDGTINGGEGNDTIKGSGTHNTIEGGAGDDTIEGGSGDDTIEGGDGTDTIIDSIGDDTIEGGNGTDTIEDNIGDDFIDISGDGPIDNVKCSLGFDTVRADQGDNVDQSCEEVRVVDSDPEGGGGTTPPAAEANETLNQICEQPEAINVVGERRKELVQDAFC